jgi:uncharacterized membrane protein
VGFKATFEGNILHSSFEISLVVKGIFAFFEIAAGVALYSVDRNFLTNLILSTFHNELQTDPHDFIVNMLLHAAQALSVSTQLFIFIYLLASGLTKIVLIAGLLRGKLGYYPAAIVVFLLFVVYQLYRYILTHGLWLVILTLVDLVVICLTWREYKDMQRRLPLDIRNDSVHHPIADVMKRGPDHQSR